MKDKSLKGYIALSRGDRITSSGLPDDKNGGNFLELHQKIFATPEMMKRFVEESFTEDFCKDFEYYEIKIKRISNKKIGDLAQLNRDIKKQCSNENCGVIEND